MKSIPAHRVIETADLKSENLTDTHVYGAFHEDIEVLDKLVVNTDGLVKQLIAVDLASVSFLRNENGNNVRVYVDSAAKTLKAQP